MKGSDSCPPPARYRRGGLQKGGGADLAVAAGGRAACGIYNKLLYKHGRCCRGSLRPWGGGGYANIYPRAESGTLASAPFLLRSEQSKPP